MADKKLTDKEIIKAYEYCINHDGCEGCICATTDIQCIVNKPKLALDLFKRYEVKLEEAEDTIQYADKEIKRLNDLINRLQAENERLNEDIQAQKSSISSLLSIVNSNYQNGKAEAYKEFAERLLNEIQEAILSNDKVISERVKKHNANRYEDDLCIMCDGKIMALGGIRYFVINLLKEMEGN